MEQVRRLIDELREALSNKLRGCETRLRKQAQAGTVPGSAGGPEPFGKNNQGNSEGAASDPKTTERTPEKISKLFGVWGTRNIQSFTKAESFDELKTLWDDAFREFDALKTEYLDGLSDETRDSLTSFLKAQQDSMESAYRKRRQKFISALNIRGELRSIMKDITNFAKGEVRDIKEDIGQAESPEALEELERQVRNLELFDLSGIELGENESGIQAFAEKWVEDNQRDLLKLIEDKKRTKGRDQPTISPDREGNTDEPGEERAAEDDPRREFSEGEWQLFHTIFNKMREGALAWDGWHKGTPERERRTAAEIQAKDFFAVSLKRVL